MTTLAAGLGALPLAIGFGEGAELRRPLGIAIIGGLIASQVHHAADHAGRLSAARQAAPPQPGGAAAGGSATAAGRGRRPTTSGPPATSHPAFANPPSPRWRSPGAAPSAPTMSGRARRTPVAFKEGRRRQLGAGRARRHAGARRLVAPVRRSGARSPRGRGRRLQPERRRRPSRRTRRRGRWCASRAPPITPASASTPAPTAPAAATARPAAPARANAFTASARRQLGAGRLGPRRGAVEGARAGAQASAADLRRGAALGAGRAGHQLLQPARARLQVALQATNASRPTSARCRSRRTATTPASRPRPTCCRRRRSC